MARALSMLTGLVMVLTTLLLFGCAENQDSGAIRTTDNNGPDRANVAIARNRGPVTKMFDRKGVDFSAPIFMRAIKDESLIELWAKAKNRDQYRLVKSYEVCDYSGELGPKTVQGDMQTPEGFYQVQSWHMKPDSAFHLAFNLGFPNRHDQANRWTGSNLMVHGDCISEGCFAMRDGPMEEIYTVATMNFEAGHGVFHFHSFPFRLTNSKLAKVKDHPWHGFWSALKPGFSIFDQQKRVPQIANQGGAYIASLPPTNEEISKVSQLGSPKDRY